MVDGCSEQSGQCSDVCDPEELGAGSPSALAHLAPSEVQISTQEVPVLENSAYDFKGTSAATRIARTAIQEVSKRAAPSRRM